MILKILFIAKNILSSNNQNCIFFNGYILESSRKRKKEKGSYKGDLSYRAIIRLLKFVLQSTVIIIVFPILILQLSLNFYTQTCPEHMFLKSMFKVWLCVWQTVHKNLHAFWDFLKVSFLALSIEICLFSQTNSTRRKENPNKKWPAPCDWCAAGRAGPVCSQ